MVNKASGPDIQKELVKTLHAIIAVTKEVLIFLALALWGLLKGLWEKRGAVTDAINELREKRDTSGRAKTKKSQPTKKKSETPKPSWKRSPSWANWMAQDEDGTWYWFEQRPEANNQLNTWYQNNDTDKCLVALENQPKNNRWRNTLEQHPS